MVISTPTRPAFVAEMINGVSLSDAKSRPLNFVSSTVRSFWFSTNLSFCHVAVFRKVNDELIVAKSQRFIVVLLHGRFSKPLDFGEAAKTRGASVCASNASTKPLIIVIRFPS